MKVLYLNHTGLMSGGERSLLELLAVLPDDISAVVGCPEGPFAAAVREAGVRTATVPAAEASLRLAPLQTPRALAGLARSALAAGRLARREQVDLVHANSVRAGLVATLARRFGAPPAVVYVHDCLPSSPPANLTRRSLLSGSAAVVANSHYTARNFAGTSAAQVRTIYYGMVGADGELVSRNGALPSDRTQLRDELGLGPGALIGLVAQITPWKGQDTAIEALDLVRRDHPGARLLLIGEAKFLSKGTRYDNSTYLSDLHRLVTDRGLTGSVDFLGERSDALRLMAALDLLVAPSWEEPFGRTIVEAMALGTPVIATATGGPAEIIEDGVSGRLVAPRDPQALADAVLELLGSSETRTRMAEAGRTAARRFGLDEYVSGIASVYNEALCSS